jgi:hypothetical protein
MIRFHSRRALSVIALATSALAAGGTVSAAPAAMASTASLSAPPFAQCPAIGQSPSCEILIVVNSDNSVSVEGDPSVGTFDGSDDTLVGIVNDSSTAIKAVTVSGPGSGLSGFDGDGICSGDYGIWDGSAGCPYGPTGYEGPGTSFVTISSLPDSAEVDFSGDLAPQATAYFSLEGALTSAQLSAREGPLVQLGCPSLAATAPVRLKKVDVPATLAGKAIKPFTIEYGNLPLTFTSVSPSPGSLCTVQTVKAGTLPVNLVFDNGLFTYHQHVADSVTTATLDFYPADSSVTQVPSCDFSLLRAIENVTTAPVLADFADTNNCLLSSSTHSSGSIIARWTSPGFREYVNGHLIYTTDPLNYFVDLSALPGFSITTSTPFATMLQALETYIHTTLIANLPMIDRIGIIQDPPAHLTITDPLGRTVGINSDSGSFPGAGYAEIGGRSIAWILEPVPGNYQVTAKGPAYSHFSVDFTVLQLLGHGTDPLAQDSAWQGILGARGTASKAFSVGGASIAPVLEPTESVGERPCKSGASARIGQSVNFSLGRSVIPFQPATAFWSFGDGTHATGDAPSHIYTTAGRFIPHLTVTDARGDTVTVQLPTVVIAAHHGHGSATR